jgi:hypothetical protein
MQVAFSKAAERNKHSILEKLGPLLATYKSVVEIGSGTGQHATYFAAALPHLQWQPTELPKNLAPLSNRCKTFPAQNLATPIVLDIDSNPWPILHVDAVFTANTLHIIHWPQVCRMFAEVGKLLTTDGLFCIYGPFNIDGRFTSDSNKRFDRQLKIRDPQSGIRDIADLQREGKKCGLFLQKNDAMPANNRLLVWRHSISDEE